MQYEVKNLISDLTGRAGITGPIPNLVEERKKKEPVHEVPAEADRKDANHSHHRRKAS